MPLLLKKHPRLSAHAESNRVESASAAVKERNNSHRKNVASLFCIFLSPGKSEEENT
jgi:hypothetical protein